MAVTEAQVPQELPQATHMPPPVMEAMAVVVDMEIRVSITEADTAVLVEKPVKASQVPQEIRVPQERQVALVVSL